MPSSPTAAKAVSLADRPASKLFAGFAALLIRRRILISAILFGLMIGRDVLYGAKPRDVFDFRDPVSVAGVLLVVAGLALRSWAAGILHKNSELTTTGPYGLIRNPLYVGSFLMMFGFCVLMGDPVNFLFVLGPVLLIYVVKVRQEERLLATRFPQKWDPYARATPRFIPRLRRASSPAEWQFSQWIHHREYQAFATTLAALVALKVWHVM
jgi:protein-S-isoprenylcysteine O-methyltransferase Ste14